MPKIEGGFSTKDPESMEKLFDAIIKEGNIKLPFVATGWKSELNEHLVTGKKEVKKSIETTEDVKKYKDSKEEKKVVKEIKKKPVKKKKSGETQGSDVRGSPMGSKKKVSRN